MFLTITSYASPKWYSPLYECSQTVIIDEDPTFADQTKFNFNRVTMKEL